MFHFKAIAYVLSLLIAISGIAMLLALPVSFSFESSDKLPLLISGLGAILLGLIGFLLSRRGMQQELKKRDGYLVVTLGWIGMSLMGSLPYYLGIYFCGPDYPIQSFTDAFFETISGFTTTGASIMGGNIEALPQGLHFWRSMTHWIGGMGIIVLTIAILPLLGIGGMQLFAAEVPGPTPDKLTPRVKETAKRLWYIYVALTALECVLLMLGDMNFYEAICHAMGTLSTGGFSTRQGSLGAFSPYSQYVVIAFMFIAGANFALTFHALRGKPRHLWRSEEFRMYLFVCLLLILVVSIILFFQEQMDGEEAIRTAAFQVIAIITTTGFGTGDFTSWGPFLMVLFFVLMFSGACAGSTSGAIKIIRSLVVFKNSKLELTRQVHPKAILPVRVDGKAIPKEVVTHIVVFFLIFLLLFVVGVFVMAPMVGDLDTAFGSVAATLGNIGPGIGEVGPGNTENFAAIPTGGKWFLSFLMLVGRLEIFTVLLVLTPVFWRG